MPGSTRPATRRCKGWKPKNWTTCNRRCVSCWAAPSSKSELTHLSLKPVPNGESTLTGQAKGQEQRIARVSLTVTGAGAITAIEIEEVDGAITSFTFTGEVPNAPVPPGAMRFNAPAGVPVIDAPPPV